MATKVVTKYSKEELKNASSLSYSVDLLEVLLEDGKEYSLDEVDRIVNKFNKRKVEF